MKNKMHSSDTHRLSKLSNIKLQNPQQNSMKKSQKKEESLDNRLSAQILRVKTYNILKRIEHIWHYSQEELCEFMNEYQSIPYSQIQAKQLFTFPKVKLIKSENKIYLGQIQQKKKHGIGIAIYKEGKIYEGQFILNEKNGFGCQIYPNGNLYIGDFNQNKKHGVGVFYWFNMCQSSSTKNAQVYIQHYSGQWWGGLPDGQGEHHKINGDLYFGRFKNGLKHGDGVQYYGNGDMYKGQFMNGVPQGHGFYTWEDKSTYKGDFKQGFRNGYGIWCSNSKKSQTYEGHYMLDKKHGYGVYTWGNGYHYKGNFTQDLRNGQGQLFYQDEVVYDGLWVNGEKYEDDANMKGSRLLTSSKYSKMTKCQSSQHPTKLNRLLTPTKSITPAKSIQKKLFKKNSKKSLGNSPSSNQFYVSFRQQQQDEIRRSGHRDCIPCNIKRQQSKQNNLSSGNKSLRKMGYKSSTHIN